MNEQSTMTELLQISIKDLKPSQLNPRKHFNEGKLLELAASIKEKGVLQPIVVRPSNGKYEIVCGERRWRAASAAGVEKIPAVVRELDDQETLELQMIENLQRDDMHPMEEAEGYFALSRRPGYDAAKIAEKIGRSEKYVYDRLKLLSLIKPAQKLFWEDKFTAGHAILLARLSPSEQARAIDPDSNALFEGEKVQYNFLDEKEQEQGIFKCVSVREFSAWIDEHVRFQRDKVDPMLFPETSAAIADAKEKAEKIVPITDDHYVQTSARSDERIIGPRSWHRADGKTGSKTCDHSVTGVFVVGPGRGQAIKVCISKEKCKVHWGQWQNERKERAQQTDSATSGKERARQEAAEKQRQEAEKRNTERRARFDKAKPAILKAVAEAIKKMPVNGKGVLAEVLIEEVRGHDRIKSDDLLPIGQTAEDLVRHLANIAFAKGMNGWNAHEHFPPFAKSIGLDVWKVVNEAAPRKGMENEKKTNAKTKKT